ncbi:G-D-S-L family lipolytic protein [Robiginitalea sp. IMCC43444]|uniref:G-D-S-L family lipolytic protein n=1 Tax=Robiginitalea sp. IMCC43444 TaxID=3459121 RepID=UPI0040417A6B
MKKLLALLAALGLFFVSCSDDDVITDPGPDPDPVNYTSGSADFSNYVAVGNSLTAGYSDAALFIDGQTASYPNMLAGSFALAGGGDFTIPFMADNLGALSLGGNPIFGNRLFLDFSTGDPLPTPVPGQGTTDAANILAGPFNNMGVPGAKSFHLVAPGYGNVAGVSAGLANPYFVRFASDPGTTILADAVAQNPTFFTLWIGNNDVLSFATSGGAGVDQTGNLDPTTYGGNDLTDPQVFGSVYNTLLQSLTANGAKGVVANIPDVTTIPFFTTVPFAPLDPTNPDFGPQIPLLNAQFEDLNNVFAFLGVPERSITFSTTGASALLIKDEDLPDLSAQITATLIGGGLDAPTAGLLGMLYGQARQATADDLIVFTSQTVIAELNTDAFAMLQGLGLPAETAGQLSINGITYPLEDQWVLTPEEQDMVANATANFNATIEALADTYNLGLVDANAYVNTVATAGVQLSDGSVVTATYATGGGFSLDGVHPSPRGYSLIANEFIEVIENTYGAELPRVNPLNFTGLYIN